MSRKSPVFNAIGGFVPFESQPGGPAQQHDALVLRLIVPKALGRCVGQRDNSFDPNAGAAQDYLQEFFGQVCRQIGQQIDHSRPIARRLTSQELEPWYLPAIDLDRLQKHLLRPYPQTPIAILLAIDDQLLERLTVPSHFEHGILFALVVTIAPGRNRGHHERFIQVIESCNTVAIETQTKYGAWAKDTQR